MTWAHIQTRVWLSIGIVVLGILLNTAVSQVERRRAERGLAAIADAVLPAAQHGRDAEVAFRRVVKGYSDTFPMEGRSGLDRAAVEGSLLESLNRIGATRGISSESASSARRLAETLPPFLAEANGVYGSSPSVGERTTPESQDRIRRLAARTAVLTADLESLANGLSSDLRQRIDGLRSRSATLRAIQPAILFGTLVLALTLVNLTIRRSILAPLAETQNELAHERDLLRKTDWKSTVEKLEQSEESFRRLFATIPHAVWVYDVETLRFLKVNEAASRQYGYSAEEFEHITASDLHPPAEASRLQTILAQLWDSPDPVLPQGAWQYRTRAGDLLEVEVHAHLLRFKDRPAMLAVVQDVTDRKRLELELQSSQRLEAVGHLAAGIAHEINTPIQFVGDNLHFIQGAFADCQAVTQKYGQLHQAVLAGDVPRGVLGDLEKAIETADMEYLAAEVPKALAQSLDGVERIATIVRAMKAFAHPGQKEKVAADLNKALADTLTVARNELKYVADVETDFGDLPPVVCHLADLNQVFLNLLVNAAHAIGTVMKVSGVKGRIGVKTRLDGDRVTVSISDTGCGIPEANRSRVFDQFFTTKEVGRGTGQGLALARSIVVEKHGGRIAFEPNPPQGTTFVVSVPTGLPVPVSPDATVAVVGSMA